LVSRVWDISSGIGSCFPLAGGLCKFYANAEENRPITEPSTLSAIQSSSKCTLSMNNFTPLVISRNDKNNQLALLSQRKLALTPKKLFAL
jgi:hypothetical protein